MNISTDKAIEFILYAVAEKQKMGLDMEQNIHVAKMELLNIRSQDMSQIETDLHLLHVVQ